jgi:exodeoxyribonuclease X
MRQIITIDFETTGIDPKKCEPVEVALYDGVNLTQTLIHTGTVLDPEVSAIHHITNDDLATAPDWKAIAQSIATRLAVMPGEPLPVLVAHNAAYERDILARVAGLPPVVWVCTYKAALRIWPAAPNHKNETLRYFLGLHKPLGRAAPQLPHSAAHDALVTHALLTECLKHATLEELIQWTDEPAKLPKMPMGKHMGQTWDTVPAPYLKWCTQQADMREDVKHAAAEELKRRR